MSLLLRNLLPSPQKIAEDIDYDLLIQQIRLASKVDDNFKNNYDSNINLINDTKLSVNDSKLYKNPLKTSPNFNFIHKITFDAINSKTEEPVKDTFTNFYEEGEVTHLCLT